MMRRRPLLLGLLAFDLMVVVVVLVVLHQHHQQQRHPSATLLDTPVPGGASLATPHFTLQDCQGHRVSERTYRGQVLLVYFGYSFCPDVCPTELGFQARLLKALGDDARSVVPLFITIDPARDTASHLASYVALFDPRLVGLTGSEAQIRQAADAFGAWYQRTSPDARRMDAGGPATASASRPVGDSAAAAAAASTPSSPSTSNDPGFYLMDHSSSTYLIDRTGQLQGTIDPQGRMQDALRAVRACL